MPKVQVYDLKHSSVVPTDEAYTAAFVLLQSLRTALFDLAQKAASGDWFYRTNQSDFPFQPFGRTEGFLMVNLWLADPNRKEYHPPLIVYVSQHAGGPSEQSYKFPVLLDLAADLNTRVLGQTKRRASGVWKSVQVGTDRDVRRIPLRNTKLLENL